MILIGQYDSPFVRRVAIALNHYGLTFERRVLSVFMDFDEMLVLNPLGKVPSLVLDDGETLFESRAIIDYLESIAPEAKRLAPLEEPDRRRVLKVEAIGIGLAEKIYERGIERSRRSPGTSDPKWCERLERQILSATGWLEGAARHCPPSPRSGIRPKRPSPAAGRLRLELPQGPRSSLIVSPTLPVCC